MALEVQRAPFSFFLDPFRDGKPYSFARYGDGEWASALGKKIAPQANCDGHTYFPEMRKAFLRVFADLKKSPKKYDYLLGIQNMALGMWKPAIVRFLQQHELLDRPWLNADVFYKLSLRGRLPELVEVLRPLPVVMVGPPHLKALDQVIGYNEFVQIPAKNCFQNLGWIYQKTRSAIRKSPKPAVVAIVAGMPAELLIHQLYEEHGKHAFLIDFGSVFDPYIGVQSRSYHRGLGQDVIRAVTSNGIGLETGSAARVRPG